MLTRKTIALFVDGATCTEVPPESGNALRRTMGARTGGGDGRTDDLLLKARPR
jgi:hypothetical protein